MTPDTSWKLDGLFFPAAYMARKVEVCENGLTTTTVGHFIKATESRYLVVGTSSTHQQIMYECAPAQMIAMFCGFAFIPVDMEFVEKKEPADFTKSDVISIEVKS